MNIVMPADVYVSLLLGILFLGIGMLCLMVMQYVVIYQVGAQRRELRSIKFDAQQIKTRQAWSRKREQQMLRKDGR